MGVRDMALHILMYVSHLKRVGDGCLGMAADVWVYVTWRFTL